MKKYKVVFEERYNGKWQEDYFSNNGEGFNYNDALYIKNDLQAHDLDGIPVRDVRIEEMETMESRIITNANGFKVEQIRFIPYPEWDPCEGWRTVRYVD